MARARKAFETLFSAYRPALIGRLARLVSCRDTAEDLAHEAYMRVAAALDRQPVDHVPTFLFQTAHNLAIDHLRRETRHNRLFDRGDPDVAAETVPSREASPETTAADRQALERLVTALDGLPERTRQVLVLSRLEGLSYPAIARRLGISQSTVYKDIQTALAHCLDAVEKNPPGRGKK